MKAVHPGVLFGAIGWAMLFGCSSDATTSSDDTSDLSAATEAALDDANDLDGSSVRPFRLGVPGPLALDAVPSGCDYDAALERFVCAAVTDDRGATRSRSYAFYDASGVAQAAYDESGTASFNIQATMDATPTREGVSGVLHHEQSLSATGLAGAETTRIWNGTITEHSQGLPPGGPGGPGGVGGMGGPPHGGGPGGGPRGGGPGGGPSGGDRPDFSSVVFDATVTVSDVVMPSPLGEETWPVSGTITRVVHVEGLDSGTRDETSILTFNGTRYATLQVGDQTSTIDLKQRPRGPHRG
ncbi:MAG: hypothetical protein IPK72_01690 [Candidatus Eisenbacteria bacterium]|nr:hypothetical protein [Candidatus Eisenbacteria bacterium]